jgi:hypothetical protein
LAAKGLSDTGIRVVGAADLGSSNKEQHLRRDHLGLVALDALPVLDREQHQVAHHGPVFEGAGIGEGAVDGGRVNAGLGRALVDDRLIGISKVICR